MSGDGELKYQQPLGIEKQCSFNVTKNSSINQFIQQGACFPGEKLLSLGF